jgi:hypothetical protein
MASEPHPAADLADAQDEVGFSSVRALGSNPVDVAMLTQPITPKQRVSNPSEHPLFQDTIAEMKHTQEETNRLLNGTGDILKEINRTLILTQNSLVRVSF